MLRLQEVDRFAQGLYRIDFETPNQCRFPPVLPRNQSGLEAAAFGLRCYRQDPADRTKTSVQRQLTEQQGLSDPPIGPHRFVSHQKTNGHRQVEGGAVLSHIGGGQVDGDAFFGELVPAVDQGRSNALFRFADRGVGKTYGAEGRNPVRQVHLHVDEIPVDSEDGPGDRQCQHKQ